MNVFSYVLTFTEGILTFISPCTLPLVPVYFSYLAGASGGDAAGSSGKNRLLLNSIAFVAGFTIVFVVLGATAKSFDSFVNTNMDIFRKISGIIMVLFGLFFMGVLKLKFLNVEKSIRYNFKELTFLNSVIFGAVFGFSWTPCRGVFLGSALLMAGSSDTALSGIALLLFYSLGLGLPFILTSLLFENLKEAFKSIRKHQKAVNIFSGLVLILAGVLVYTDSLRFLSNLSWW